MSPTVYFVTALAVVMVLVSCGSNEPAGQSAAEHLGNTEQISTAAFPSGLPLDRLQPWEQLDGNGHVTVPPRSSSSLNLETDITPGIEYFNSAGDVTANQEAARLNGTVPDAAAWVMYRISLAAEQPAVLSIDANLLGGSSSYSVGISNYGSHRWEWHGPYRDSHVRLEAARLASDDFTSSLGNTFVMIAADRGSSLDVVGVGVNTLDLGDASAPATPLGLSATSVTGGLELNWLPVQAPDLAGYRIYYSNKSFISATSAGVRRVDYLEGSTQHVLRGLQGSVFARLSAVDLAGNASAPSEIVSGTALAGDPPPVVLETDTVSAGIAASIGLSAGGAESYDWDLDGDGIYEITDDTTDFRVAVIPGPGIVRPKVRGHSVDNTAVALGSVSLLISGNTRPAVSVTASPQNGVAPLTVSFTGEAQDAEDDAGAMALAWDFDGDGFYDDDVSGLSVDHEYTDGGTFNAKLRATDSQNAWAVDTVAIQVEGGSSTNELPTAVLTSDVTTGYAPFDVRFYAEGSFDPDGEIVLYEWDFNGDGSYEQSGEVSQIVYSYPFMGWHTPVLRVTDDLGGQATTYINITLPTEWSTLGMGYDRRGLSPHVGPQTNNILWTYSTGSQCDSSPSIALNGRIYVSGWDGLVRAIQPDGGDWWALDIGGIVHATPSIGPDGSVYTANDVGRLMAYSHSALKFWDELAGASVWSTAAITRTGDIYVNSASYASLGYSPDGKFKALFETIPGPTSISIGHDGTFYSEMSDQYMSAWTEDGTMLWSYDTGSQILNSPAVGPDGKIYFGDQSGKLTALAPDGSLLWAYDCGGAVGECKPSIGPDLTIVVGTTGNGLHAVNPDGTNRWVFSTAPSIDSSPAIDANGTSYFGAHNGVVYAVDSDGNELWSHATGSDFWGGCALSREGRLYITTFSGVLYAFGDA